MAAKNLSKSATRGDMPHPSALIVGRFSKSSGYAVSRPQGAPSWLMLWTDGGEGFVSQGAAQAHPRPGDLIVLESGVEQAYRAAGQWRFWWVHFQPRPAWLPWLRPFLLGGGCYAIRDVSEAFRPRIGNVMRRMHADARWPAGPTLPPEPVRGNGSAPIVLAGSRAAHDLALTAIEEILLLATTAAAPVSLAVDERVQLAQALIAADPAAPHTVATLARQVSLSASRFAHLFVEVTGRTPMQTVREARLRHAAQLLEVTNLSVSQIAAGCGFESPFHFSRLFSQRYGSSPRGFRGALSKKN